MQKNKEKVDDYERKWHKLANDINLLLEVMNRFDTLRKNSRYEEE